MGRLSVASSNTRLELDLLAPSCSVASVSENAHGLCVRSALGNEIYVP